MAEIHTKRTSPPTLDEVWDGMAVELANLIATRLDEPVADLLKRAFTNARKAERQAVVRWLRAQADEGEMDAFVEEKAGNADSGRQMRWGCGIIRDAADAIKSAAHLAEPAGSGD